MSQEAYAYIRSVCEQRSLPHARNLLGKHDKGQDGDVLDVIAPEYAKYLKTNLSISGFDQKSVEKRVAALNGYYDYLHVNGYDNAFKSQSKFRPTILEEFMSLLFGDVIADYREKAGVEDDALSFGSVKAHANLYFYGSDFVRFVQQPTIGINQKDQDFAVYRKAALSIDSQRPIRVCLPVIAVENKTYIDKTMFEGSVATAEKIKAGNPYCLFYIVTEWYDVSFDVDPVYSRIDQIYVLRKSKRKGEWTPIDAGVVCRLVEDVIAHFGRPWSEIERKLSDTGVLI